jgi:hypothetical protein
MIFLHLLTYMEKMLKQTLALTVFLIGFNSFSQEEGWMSFRSNERDSTDTTKMTQTLDYSKEDGEVKVHKDKRIDELEKFVRFGEESLDGVLIDGYRVLIYFDQDKGKAEQQKAHFMSLYNDVTAYVDYSAPNYRVRVGNYRTRLEAEKLKQDILGIFPTAIVVEDKIQLPKLDNSSN